MTATAMPDTVSILVPRVETPTEPVATQVMAVRASSLFSGFSFTVATYPVGCQQTAATLGDIFDQGRCLVRAIGFHVVNETLVVDR